MDKRLFFIMFLGFVLFVLGGCGSVPKYNYYTLQSIPREEVGSRSVMLSSNISLGLEPVMIPAWLDQKNLTFSDGAVRLIRHDYDRWMEPLSELLTRNMVQNLRYLTKSSVTGGPWVRSARPEIIITVEINSIAVVNGVLRVDSFWKIHGSGREHQFEVEKVYLVPLARQGAGSFAVALSKSWGDMAKEIGEAL
ncbi:MAG: ABC-type transport auxiliary lipoprotein family protein [Candidatus Endonucleobacter sp. (ex Gigantidas childressi)]|nr:ABC-type transport auxiliary lipoprotein family protein [Candidatus Endonucleobacter sp. (ex Gigantidas childressi)]